MQLSLLRLSHHQGGARVETVEDGHDLLFALGVEHGKEGVSDGTAHSTVCGPAKPRLEASRQPCRCQAPIWAAFEKTRRARGVGPSTRDLKSFERNSYRVPPLRTAKVGTSTFWMECL